MSEPSDAPLNLADIQVDTSNLYREEIITDLRVASIRKMVPIKPDGSDDPSREPIFTVQTTLMSQGGPLPVQCQLEATNLEEAAAAFPQGIQDAVERMVEDAREMQRREASRIVVPNEMPGNLRGPGGGSGIIS